MKQEEKIEEAKRLYQTANADQRYVLESLFPELKESEEEKMWKLIKKYAHYNISDTALEVDHITREQLESWLEKQGKQKPADKVEPKFHDGDWVVISTTKGDRVVQIASVEYFTKDGHPSYITTEGRWFGKGTKARLLTDKDVEIATIPESKAIVNKIESWSKEDEEELEIAIETLHKAGQYSSANWLKSFKDRVQLQSQPTWSEEDENRMKKVMHILSLDGRISNEEFKSLYDWLKSLKPQKPVDWSEEDELRVKDTIYFLDTAKKHYASTVVLDACIDWIKSIKQRIEE
jgi:hypothetical protein